MGRPRTFPGSNGAPTVVKPNGGEVAPPLFVAEL
jgi:hypothetical protein